MSSFNGVLGVMESCTQQNSDVSPQGYALMENVTVSLCTTFNHTQAYFWERGYKGVRKSQAGKLIEKINDQPIYPEYAFDHETAWR